MLYLRYLYVYVLMHRLWQPRQMSLFSSWRATGWGWPVTPGTTTPPAGSTTTGSSRWGSNPLHLFGRFWQSLVIFIIGSLCCSVWSSLSLTAFCHLWSSLSLAAFGVFWSSSLLAAVENVWSSSSLAVADILYSFSSLRAFGTQWSCFSLTRTYWWCSKMYQHIITYSQGVHRVPPVYLILGLVCKQCWKAHSFPPFSFFCHLKSRDIKSEHSTTCSTTSMSHTDFTQCM